MTSKYFLNYAILNERMTDPIHFCKSDCNENCIWVRVTTIHQNQSKHKIKLELDF